MRVKCIGGPLDGQWATIYKDEDFRDFKHNEQIEDGIVRFNYRIETISDGDEFLVRVAVCETIDRSIALEKLINLYRGTR